MKLNSSGDKQWLKAFGGSYTDVSTSIIQAADGGILISGTSNSVDYDFAGLDHGDGDIFAIKMNSSGEKQWVKTFGGSAYDFSTASVQTNDNGYFLTGGSTSNVGDFAGLNKGGEDIFVIKLNYQGEMQWTKMFGGSGDDVGNAIKESKDGAYIITRATSSTNLLGLSSPNKGSSDIIVVKGF